jgi:hypothetical protein
MNVNAVGSATPTPAMTAVALPGVAVQGVAATEATRDATSQTRRAHQEAMARPKAADPPPPPKLPPLKPISTTEMRVMLGQLPPGVAGRAETRQLLAGQDGGSFDAYA